MPPTATTLDTAFDYCQELLALCQTLLATTEDATVEDNPGGEIDRAYVGFGRAVGAGGPLCEEISVSWNGFGEAQTAAFSPLSAGRRQIYGRLNLQSFLVTVVRDCVPILSEDGEGAPEIARIHDSASELMRDASALWFGIYREAVDNGLFGGRCSEVFMIRCDPLEPMADFAGFELEIACQIDGIISAGGS